MLTDNELIQAMSGLHHCQKGGDCSDCDLSLSGGCFTRISQASLDISIRLSNLVSENNRFQKRVYDLEHENEVLRSQTIPLRAEQLPECLRPSPIGADT